MLESLPTLEDGEFKKLEIMKQLLERFGDDVKIGIIAQYAQDEYMIPCSEAVWILYGLA